MNAAVPWVLGPQPPRSPAMAPHAHHSECAPWEGWGPQDTTVALGRPILAPVGSHLDSALNTGSPGYILFVSCTIEDVWCVCVSCPTLFDPMGCSQSVHGISQARILEWIAIPFSQRIFLTWGSSQPWDGTFVSCTAGRFFTI